MSECTDVVFYVVEVFCVFQVDSIIRRNNIKDRPSDLDTIYNFHLKLINLKLVRISEKSPLLNT